MVIIGVDPNAPTLRPLEDSCKQLGLVDGRAGEEMHLVLAASGAKRGKAIMNEHCEVPGEELCQITNTTTDLSVPGLDIFPVDSLSEAPPAIASDPLLSVLESFRATPATLYALSAPSV